MRKRFEQQISLGIVPISEVKISLKSRDELPPVMMALQYIFITPELSNKVFELLEQKIVGTKKQTGRNGMDLWHILVLAVIRHTCNTNWDTLETWANQHLLIRRILGVHSNILEDEEQMSFSYQTILDNVSLLDEELLQKINLLVVEAGHKLVKKKADEPLELKTDSYVVEKNVHFPTDLSLLWDSLRKCLDLIEDILAIIFIAGWRKLKQLYRKLKRLFRLTSHQVFKGKNEALKQQCVKEYLKEAKEISDRVTVLLADVVKSVKPTKSLLQIIIPLTKYKDYVNKFIDQIDRRLLQKQVIDASEKVFSIFEEDTEWITKGKLGNKVELGHLVLVTTDQYDFMIDYKVMEKQKDAQQVAGLCERIKTNFSNTKIQSHSFDKGFWSADNLKTLQETAITVPILPKRGRHSKADKERESTKQFTQYRRLHSAVESNINMLEHHGLDMCRDKGIKGFKRCVGISVLAYNLHQIGNIIKAKKCKKKERLIKSARKDVQKQAA